MSTAREPCPNCQLPFYTERNGECPYCGATPSDGPAPPSHDPAGDTSATTDTTAAGSVARGTPPERPRTTCAHCGLPHYADDVNGCPYCDVAGVSPTESDRSASTAGAGRSDSTGSTAAPERGLSADDQPGDRESASDGSRSSGGILASLKRLVGR